MRTKLKGWRSTYGRAWHPTWQGSSGNLVSEVTCSRGIETAICSSLTQFTGEDDRISFLESQMEYSALRCKAASREAAGDIDQVDLD